MNGKKTLPPQQLKEADYAQVRESIEEMFFELIFEPLAKAVAKTNEKTAEIVREFRNTDSGTHSALLVALRTGAVQYTSGVFSGSFSRHISAALRSIGATFDRREGVYRLADSQIPVDVRAAALTYEGMAKGAHDVVLQKLNEAQERVASFVRDYDLSAEAAVDAVAEGFKKSAEQLEVMPQLTPESLAVLEEEYTENLKLYIQGFMEHEIVRLRREVEDNARAGYRFDRLAKIVKEHTKVSQYKAEFLARQETALFMSEFRRRNFAEAGVTRYIWKTSKDQRVRDSHAHLDGKVFFYNDPPIVDAARGRRANPGQDYNCRCIDVPVLDPVKIGD